MVSVIQRFSNISIRVPNS